MSSNEIEIRPVTHITTDAIGPPGKRVFYLQGWQGERTATVIIEKVQIQSLAVGLEQFLSEIYKKYPQIEETPADYTEDKMHISPPVDPLFRVGEVGLGYDIQDDLVVLIAKELISEDDDEEQAGVIRFWCTRAQLRALCHWGTEVASRGRPTCNQCGKPIDPEGHICPKKNGHKK